MVKKITRNRNTSDAATLGAAVALNATTSTLVAAANATRINFTLTNASQQDVWIKLQAASVDNVKKGIFIGTKHSYEMPTDNIYTGEISAISVSGTPSVFVTEF